MLVSRLLLVLLLPIFSKANCDVYKRTMDSVEYWESYDFSEGMRSAIEEWYAPDAKITSSTSAGSVTRNVAEYYATFKEMQIAKMKIDIRDIDCAFDGEWCHLKVYTTYYSLSPNSSTENTVSIPQYWTLLYDPVTCKWSHYVILQHANDLSYMMDTLGGVVEEQQEEDEL